MEFTYPKAERLKSRTAINSLFIKGKSIAVFPLRLAYIETTLEPSENIKIGVSVSKKHFKKAVDRNYFKRVLRECYRLNKHLIVNKSDKKYAIMFFYQTKDRLSYQEIHEKTVQLFLKFAARENP